MSIHGGLHCFAAPAIAPQSYQTVTTHTIYTCAACKQPIHGPRVSAEGRDFHPECFRCTRCQTVIQDGQYRIGGNGEPLCRNCSNVVCAKCGQYIEGQVMQAEGKNYHPQCFTCDACGVQLADGQFYRSEVDGFATRKCHACANKVQTVGGQASTVSVTGPTSQAAMQGYGSGAAGYGSAPPASAGPPSTTTTVTETWTTTPVYADGGYGSGYGAPPGKGYGKGYGPPSHFVPAPQRGPRTYSGGYGAPAYGPPPSYGPPSSYGAPPSYGAPMRGPRTYSNGAPLVSGGPGFGPPQQPVARVQVTRTYGPGGPNTAPPGPPSSYGAPPPGPPGSEARVQVTRTYGPGPHSAPPGPPASYGAPPSYGAMGGPPMSHTQQVVGSEHEWVLPNPGGEQGTQINSKWH